MIANKLLMDAMAEIIVWLSKPLKSVEIFLFRFWILG
jgi:hypothetical protein